MAKETIVIIGGGGHAKVVASIIKKSGRFELLGYVDKQNRGPLLGVPYLGADDVLPQLRAEHSPCAAVIGIGYIGEGTLREHLIEKLLRFGFEMPAIISSHAVVNEEVKIEVGAVVMDGVVVNSGSQVGKYVILNTHSSIDHDCQIGDFVHIAPGATLSGGVTVGAHSLVGAGATVVQYKTVGDHCIIGAGAVVTKDCLEQGTYIGIPAKKLL